MERVELTPEVEAYLVYARDQTLAMIQEADKSGVFSSGYETAFDVLQGNTTIEEVLQRIDNEVVKPRYDSLEDMIFGEENKN
jgi:hypothetical protein